MKSLFYFVCGLIAVASAMADQLKPFKILSTESASPCAVTPFQVRMHQDQDQAGTWVTASHMQMYDIAKMDLVSNMRGSSGREVIGASYKATPGPLAVDSWCLPEGIYSLTLGIDTARIGSSVSLCDNIVVKSGESITWSLDATGACSILSSKDKKSVVAKEVNAYSIDNGKGSFDGFTFKQYSWGGKGSSGVSVSGLTMAFSEMQACYSYPASMQSQPVSAPVSNDISIQVSVGVSLAGITSIEEAELLSDTLIAALKASINKPSVTVTIAGFSLIEARRLTGVSRALTVTGVEVTFYITFLASQVLSGPSSSYSMSDAITAMSTLIQTAVSGNSQTSFLATLQTLVASNPTLANIVSSITGVTATELTNISPTAAPTTAPAAKKAADSSIAIIAGAAGGGGGVVVIGLIIYYMRQGAFTKAAAVVPTER